MEMVMKCNDCGSKEVEVTNLFMESIEAVETYRTCKKCGSNNINNKPQLLKIELDDINSVPRVFYKGEEITRRIRIAFEWKTQPDTPILDTPKIEIEHAVFEGERIHTKHIGFNTAFKGT